MMASIFFIACPSRSSPDNIPAGRATGLQVSCQPGERQKISSLQ